MARVYLPHVPTRYDHLTNSRVPSVDFGPAAAFGQLVELTTYDRAISSDEIDDALEQIQTNLSQLTDRDYIVAAGDPILIAAAVSYAHDLIGVARVLRWDRQTKKYNLVEVVL